MLKTEKNTAALSVPGTATKKQSTATKMLDPATEAGQAMVDFYKTDAWEEGNDPARRHVVSKNTIPPALSHLFLRSTKSDPVTDETTYDRKLFGIDEYPYFTDKEKGIGGAQIRSHLLKQPIANITFDTNTFVVRLLAPPKSEKFPFTGDSLLKAIDAAKWQIELYCLPPSESESDNESEKT